MIERDLRELADWVELPAGRDLAPAVRARLRGRPGRKRGLVVALAAALLALAAALAVPPARSAILRFLHLQGVTIEIVDRLPAVAPTRPLDLGRPVPFADAGRVAGFRPLSSQLLGRPDRVTWDGVQLWFAWGHTRLLVSQLRAGGVDRFIKKVLGAGTRIDPVVVDGGRGYFLSGASHFLYVLPTGPVRDERVRLARDVLLWQHGSLTLRLEGELTLPEAVSIARSFR